MPTITARTPVLDIAVEVGGAEGGPAVVLLHGFPYDPRSFDEVVPRLQAKGLRTVVPYLRGFGATTFRSADTMRSGEQAAIGQDLLDLLDALSIDRALLAGFDWGARAACIAAALSPERVSGLVTVAGYQVQDLATSTEPADPGQEHRFWYQYYFHTERGRLGLERHRRSLCRLLWSLWSPTWAFDDETFERTARAFENPDFVEVSVHSYRHRHRNAPGDPGYAAVQDRLAAMPRIPVPTICLQGEVDGVNPPALSEGHGRWFTDRYERRILAGIGHNPPQEAPAAFAQAILELR